MRKLFGTDGVRGIVNEDLTVELSLNIGKALGSLLKLNSETIPNVIIGKDTRLSSDMIESALMAGLCSVGCNVELLGVVPTPAVSILVQKYNSDAGVMISASHNPYHFNGIKIFDKTGMKLSDKIEAEIESMVFNINNKYQLAINDQIGIVEYNQEAKQDYINYIINNINPNLNGLKIAIDCANGSASYYAFDLFSSLGAEPYVINNIPNGTNINAECGSTYLENLVKYMKTIECDIGVAFDGDGDRCLAVDEKGNLIDGDKMMAILANYYKTKNCLKNNSVVVTVMTNLGFNHFAQKHGISVIASDVGDKNVLENMLKGGYNLGGEQSGHIIFSDYAKTGDGQLTSVILTKIMKETCLPISELSSIMERVPQVIINVKVNNDNKHLVEKDTVISKTILECNQSLADKGRVLVRASGTEPLIRIMVEGFNFDEINKYALKIAQSIKERLA